MSEAEAELTALSLALNKANHAYHSADTPSISDAEYDRLKQRNLSIETVFPELKRRDSPTDQVGAAPADGFAKLQHKQRMLSLGNAFTNEDVADFDLRIRRYLGLSEQADLVYTAEPKIDGLSLSLRYEQAF